MADIQKMREELETNGWEIVQHHTTSFVQIIRPDGYDCIYSADFERNEEDTLHFAISDAYSYFQERQELEALREFTSHVLEETQDVIEKNSFKPLEKIDPNSYIQTQVFVRYLQAAAKVLKKER
jgi:hypothetical protein